MSTLIVYGSTHGFTEMCAQRLAQRLPGEVVTVDLSTHPHPDLAAHGIIVIGGSIHLGTIQPVVGEFCAQERDALIRHPLALFISCMKRDEEAAQQFDNAFALRLRAHAFATAHLGGAFYFDRMTLLQRWVVRNVVHVDRSTEELDEFALNAFTAQLSRAIRNLDSPRPLSAPITS